MKRAEWQSKISALPAGMTLMEAATVLGEPYRKAYTWLKAFGYGARPGRGCQPGRRSKVDWSSVDWSRKQSDIARELNVSRQAVHDMKRRMAK